MTFVFIFYFFFVDLQYILLLCNYSLSILNVALWEFRQCRNNAGVDNKGLLLKSIWLILTFFRLLAWFMILNIGILFLVARFYNIIVLWIHQYFSELTVVFSRRVHRFMNINLYQLNLLRLFNNLSKTILNNLTQMTRL